MRLHHFTAAAMLALSLAPAQAALITQTGKGAWTSVAASSTTWTGSEDISYSVTWDDSLHPFGPEYDEIVSYEFKIGDLVWTQADFYPLVVPVPLRLDNGPAGVEFITFSLNADFSALFTGVSVFGPAPAHTFMVTDKGAGLGGDPSFGVLLQPIPEPASWALLTLGFAMIGGTVRWRGRKFAIG